ncbi:hypothetical protein [Mycobacteroides abscessus]|uniref:hypothetical protein n=1 Tax=Mycobacteroides abscessus TaxID=36809 RepID=UPI00266FD927|nr:hypothetical protein [Mycobacteroides abscessus]MDO3110441.1 hypothetical protein [Mycobacteroides abscessus subsp. abscessus]
MINHTSTYARDSRALYQEWCGYLVSGDTSREVSLALVGPPRSGKTGLAAGVEAFLGRENVARTTPSQLTRGFGLKQLVGKFAAIVEGGNFTAASTTALCRINTGDSPATGCRVMILANDIPTFAGADAPTVEEQLLVVHTWGQVPDDPGFAARLASERSGILNWALDGLDRLNRNGDFTRPQMPVRVA